MTNDDHLTPESTANQVHRHLLESCPECREPWNRLGPLLQDVLLQLAFSNDSLHTGPAEQRLEVARDDLSATPEVLEDLEGLVHELRRIRRRAKKQLSELRTASPARRPEMIRRAISRFRHSPLAHLLIDEARVTVHNDPDEALSFASLVPLVIDWAREPGGPPWVSALLARAEAHRANALRVRGDLPEAEAAFAALNKALELRPLVDPGVAAEISSLEASLSIDQRKFEDAEILLQKAAVAFAQADDADGLVRTRIKQANLRRAAGAALDQLRILDQAAQHLPENADAILLASLTAGRVNALCDLDRAAEARPILAAHLDAFEDDESPYAAAMLRGLQGRIALGLGQGEVAEDLFRTCGAVMRDLGRHYDASLAALYLAESLLAQQRMEDLHALATRLVKDFRGRGIDREAEEAFQLLAQATLARTLSATILSEVRQALLRISVGRPSGR